MPIFSAVFAVVVVSAAVTGWYLLRRKNLDRWAGSYILTSHRRIEPGKIDEPLDVFIAVCDHYEPEWNRPSKNVSIERVRRWHQEYPRLFGRFADSSGRPPQHTFFFPADEYAPEYLDLLADLCSQGYGDVDIHLHHDNDTADGLRTTLESFKQILHDRHGLLRRDPISGEIVYGFIHGNWALCNSRPDGRWCGVNDEIPILLETGCYADFTMPSAPVNTQTRTINSIYYAHNCPGRPKSHDCGIRARVGNPPPENNLLMIQGPLVLDWTQRKYGLLPGIENGDLHGRNAPSWKRMQNWLRAGVRVDGRPNWVFVKLHTHGAKDGNIDMWLGDRAQEFHAELATQAAINPNFRYHYVTAWEMANLVHQAEQGSTVPEFVPMARDRHAFVACQ